MRVVFDCNIYVSFALGSQKLQPIKTAWRERVITTIISTYLLKEIESVLKRDKFKPFINEEEIDFLLSDIKRLGEEMLPKHPFPDFRDPKDRYLLAMLRDSQAQVLVTGDNALLDLDRFMDKPILTPNYFMRSYLTAEDDSV